MNAPGLTPVLETERLVLRGHRVSDFHDTASLWADQQVVAYISGAPSTREQSWSRLLRYAGHWQFLGFGYWVVVSKADDSFLGEVGFADLQRDTDPDLTGKPEAGWVFNVRAHGQGYASEAVSAMLAWADANLTCSHTSAIFDPDHTVSIRLARKVGYSNPVLGRYGDRETLFMERERSEVLR
ncbi:MAG: GNAT family N-acetyltransferase [Pseudomonadota bacterium]